MLAAVCSAPGEFEVRQVDDPAPGPGELLIEVAACGICGTDLHIADGTYHAEYPAIPGHELTGTVSALGEGVSTPAVGTRVAINPNLPCRRCRQCRRGRPHLCEDAQAVGVTRPGDCRSSGPRPGGKSVTSTMRPGSRRFAARPAPPG